jgi:hypothetical protein
MKMEVSEVRRRLRAAIEQARRQAAIRRERSDAAARDYEQFLSERAIPVLQTLAAALTAERRPFQVFTPAGSVRLADAHSNEEFIELALDASGDEPVLVVRTSRGRGRRQVTTERVVRKASEIAGLAEEDALGFVLDVIEPFVER